MNYLFAAGVIIFAYLIGSVNFAVIISNIFTGKDVRKSGSGNAGATNVLRTVGVLPGTLTFLLDALKGFAACFAGKTVFSLIFAQTEMAVFTPQYGAYICCLAVMLGHVFPLFFGFKGGKAVACSVGTFSVCCPVAIILGLLAFAVCLIISKIVSLSSLVATVVVVGTALVFEIFSTAEYNVLPTIIMIIIAGTIVFVKHKKNIIGLINGTEKKIKAKK